jgi:catechol 2,3-dioxygenase-like lactoylglutathione lyase family enzyme
MKLKHSVKISTMAIALFAMTNISEAQLAAPNAEGVSAGHTHLVVPDLAKSRAIWKSFGGVEKSSGTLQFLQFPGMDILFREQTPTSGSGATSANHIAFSVKSYADYKAKLEAVGAKFVIDNAETGQILADLPSGVRIEFVLDENQVEPIKFHHTHLSAVDQAGLRDWYVKVFGADVGERAGMPSAVIPGGRVDVIAARGPTPLPTQGAAIDHIGFEVADMDAFAAKMEKLGIAFSRPPERRDEINLTIAFIVDPVGTNIEITEGLDDVK